MYSFGEPSVIVPFTNSNRLTHYVSIEKFSTQIHKLWDFEKNSIFEFYQFFYEFSNFRHSLKFDFPKTKNIVFKFKYIKHALKISEIGAKVFELCEVQANVQTKNDFAAQRTTSSKSIVDVQSTHSNRLWSRLESLYT